MDIKEGDYVYIIVEARGKRKEHFFKVQRGGTYSTIAGIIRAEDIIGSRWGTILELQAGRAYVLPPSRYELMRYALERVGQVIYPKDLGYIIEISGVMPGMKVLEAGVGSGFLTIALAIAVGEKGRVIGYDVRRDAIEATKRNLSLLGLLERVELRLGDVKEGLDDMIDIVFLDLPDPWAVLERIHKNLPDGGSAVVFVPTYNQLEKIYNNLVAKDLYVIQESVEIMRREIEIRPGAVRPATQMIGHTGFIVLLRKVSVLE